LSSISLSRRHLTELQIALKPGWRNSDSIVVTASWPRAIAFADHHQRRCRSGRHGDRRQPTTHHAALSNPRPTATLSSPRGCYNAVMRRLVFAMIVGALSFSASGATGLILAEPCSGYELAGQNDGACPPTCVTCGCCAHPAEPVAIATGNSPDAPLTELIALLPRLPRNDPGDILHVPKLRRA
jgi:hypothetical protein